MGLSGLHKRGGRGRGRRRRGEERAERKGRGESGQKRKVRRERADNVKIMALSFGKPPRHLARQHKPDDIFGTTGIRFLLLRKRSGVRFSILIKT